jgi:hypothetical protein
MLASMSLGASVVKKAVFPTVARRHIVPYANDRPKIAHQISLDSASAQSKETNCSKERHVRYRNHNLAAHPTEFPPQRHPDNQHLTSPDPSTRCSDLPASMGKIAVFDAPARCPLQMTARSKPSLAGLPWAGMTSPALFRRSKPPLHPRPRHKTRSHVPVVPELF